MTSKFKLIHILIIIIGVILSPVILNIILKSPNFWIEGIGNEIDWLAFWGSYGGATIGGLITLYVLYKTLTQNDNNNTASKDLQLAIVKAQFKQNWLDNFIVDLKEIINYVNLVELREAIFNINANPNKARDFISKEIVRTSSKPIEFNLHFDESIADDLENQFMSSFNEHAVIYHRFIVFLGRTLTLLNNSTDLKNARSTLKKFEIIDDQRKDEILTKDELEQLITVGKLEKYLAIMDEIIQKRLSLFLSAYEIRQVSILSQTQIIVNHERNKLLQGLE